MHCLFTYARGKLGAPKCTFGGFLSMYLTSYAPGAGPEARSVAARDPPKRSRVYKPAFD